MLNVDINYINWVEEKKTKFGSGAAGEIATLQLLFADPQSHYW